MLTDRDRDRNELFGAWCAPVFTVLTVVGFLVLAGFVAPAAADLPPERLAAVYAEHRTAMVLGLSIFCVATGFLLVYCVQFSLALWRIEGGPPLFSAVQALGGLAVVLLIFISNCLWIGAAYRAGEADPDVTVALNDAAWFGFLVGWVMLSVQMLAAAAITLRDRRDTPFCPRWLSWASVVGAVVLATANGCVFARSGTFAWTGFLGYYLPMAIWGVWLDGHAWFVRREVRTRSTASRPEGTAATSAGRVRRDPADAVDPAFSLRERG